jgi:hypothetical protein
MKTRQNEIGFVPAPEVSLGSDLLGRLVAFRPTRTEVIETKIGPAEAVLALVLEVTDKGYVSHGEHPVFWTLVRRQLSAATPEAPWVVGRLTRSGQAYRLDPPTEQEAQSVSKALTDFTGF